MPRFDPSFNPLRFTRATGKSCPSIDRGGVKKEYTSRNASVSTRAAVFFFPSSVRSTLDARLRSILLVVLDRATVVDGARVLFPLSSSECVQFAVSDPQICIGFTGSSLVFTREKR